MCHRSRMDTDLTDNELLADMIADVALDVRQRIGDDNELQFQFFRAFVELAKRTVPR